MKTLAIIGGGAAGLAAAAEAARRARRCGLDLRVTVYEADQKVGRSILRSGNGRCNFSNAGIDPWGEGALKALYANGGFVAQVLQELERTADADLPSVAGALPARLGKTGEGPGQGDALGEACDWVALDAATNQALAFFRWLGLAWRTEGEGRMYPYANKAQSVLDALRAALDMAGVQVRLESPVANVEPPRVEGACVTLRMVDGSFERADRAIVAVGGTLGRDLLGDCADFVPARPVLGPLAALPLFEEANAALDKAAFPSASAKKAKGKGRKKAAAAGASAVLNGLDNTRVRCAASLFRPCQGAQPDLVAQEAGEVLFRKYGLSGIAVFNLSRLAQAGDVLQLDVLPELSADQARAWLQQRLDWAAGRQLSMARALEGFLLPNVAHAVCLAAKVAPAAPARASAANALAQACKGLQFSVCGVGDAAQCQVHAGGVRIDQVDPTTMQLYAAPAVQVVGEALDVDAPCGGYNLHWAWSSGMLAARSVVSGLQ